MGGLDILMEWNNFWNCSMQLSVNDLFGHRGTTIYSMISLIQKVEWPGRLGQK